MQSLRARTKGLRNKRQIYLRGLRDIDRQHYAWLFPANSTVVRGYGAKHLEFTPINGAVPRVFSSGLRDHPRSYVGIFAIQRIGNHTDVDGAGIIVRRLRTEACDAPRFPVAIEAHAKGIAAALPRCAAICRHLQTCSWSSTSALRFVTSGACSRQLGNIFHRGNSKQANRPCRRHGQTVTATSNHSRPSQSPCCGEAKSQAAFHSPSNCLFYKPVGLRSFIHVHSNPHAHHAWAAAGRRGRDHSSGQLPTGQRRIRNRNHQGPGNHPGGRNHPRARRLRTTSRG